MPKCTLRSVLFKMNSRQFHRKQDNLMKKSPCPSNEIREITHYLLYLHISSLNRRKFLRNFEQNSCFHHADWQQLPRNTRKARWEDGNIFLWKVRGYKVTVILLKDSRGRFALYLNFQETSVFNNIIIAISW